MIYAIGTDITNTARISEGYKLLNDAFAHRILTENEYSIFQNLPKSQRVSFLTKRWTAKEAVAKALTMGFTKTIDWHNIEIVHTALGQPQVQFLNELNEHIRANNFRTHITISDDVGYATATCIIEQ
jgi:holo-[acyl-carrier protein] synthase